jgi:2,3-bisphosphoglycerate-independent phosphoglycerate mutase
MDHMKGNAKPAVLLVLDGWGYSESDDFNAIRAARTPVWDRLWQEHPHTLIGTSGSDVGLPSGQMGNSEVGHLNLGAGRVVFQEFTRVSRAVESEEFFANTALNAAVEQALAANGALHIFGLLSPGGVHSHEEHIHAMVRMALEKGCERVYVHAFLDGRDTPPRSAAASLEALQKVMEQAGGGRIASLIGRYYAMDRDNRWERVQIAYDMLTQGKAEFAADDALAGLQAAYDRDETDEFVKATRIGEAAPIEDGDAIVFMNYRADRARELTRTFTEEGFDGFRREKFPRLSAYVTLTEYSKDFDVQVAFPPEQLANGFGEYLAAQGLRQLRLAETEKYAHVTFFFNGGREETFAGEERILVPSPKVATYDLQPEMSATEVTDNLVTAIESGDYDAIICNFANPDMVGHTGIYEAAVKAIETIDQCLGRIMDALQRSGGELLITADHGNAEQMVDRTSGQPHTAHTNNPVPLVYVGRRALLQEHGALCDIAPTLLQIMGLEQPPEMSGHSLVSFPEAMAS